MRGTVAKRLRKDASAICRKTGNWSILKKVYEGTKTIISDKQPPREINTITVKYSGYRRVYQDLKEAYYARSHS